MQLSVLRRPLLEDYGQILLLPLTVRERSRLDYLVGLERLTPLAISIKGPHITRFIGLLQLELISLIHNISSSQFMFSSLTLLGLACNHGHHIRATPLLPRPYAPRLTIQFTPLSMTLTRAFEKLRDAGVIVSLAPRPLPYPILPHFCLHEYCLYHHIQGHDAECCVALHHVIKDLIDSRLVNLFGPSVTTNPLPTHFTHAVPSLPSLQ